MPTAEDVPAFGMDRHGVHHGPVHVKNEGAHACHFVHSLPPEGTFAPWVLIASGGFIHQTPCFNDASMNGSRSPSSTFWVLEISTFVRRSLMRLWSST